MQFSSSALSDHGHNAGAQGQDDVASCDTLRERIAQEIEEQVLWRDGMVIGIAAGTILVAAVLAASGVN